MQWSVRRSVLVPLIERIDLKRGMEGPEPWVGSDGPDSLTLTLGETLKPSATGYTGTEARNLVSDTTCRHPRSISLCSSAPWHGVRHRRPPLRFARTLAQELHGVRKERGRHQVGRGEWDTELCLRPVAALRSGRRRRRGRGIGAPLRSNYVPEG